MNIYEGKVKSKKMQKTATVEVERVVTHPLYGKRYRRTKVYHVHDELGANVGQTVRFIDCKPVSKLKKWKVIEILKKESEGSKRNSKGKKRKVNDK